jgi:hypothetical protein
LDHCLLLFMKDLSFLFGVCEVTFLGISVETCCLAFNPFKDSWVCIERGGVSSNYSGDDLIPSSGMVSIHMAKGFS